MESARVGISYSGGGPLLPVELGIARAFVQYGIRPAIVSGASAGAIAAAAHALDMYTGQGIDYAVDELGHVRNATLKVDFVDFALRVVRQRTRLKSVGDNAAAAQLISRVTV